MNLELEHARAAAWPATTRGWNGRSSSWHGESERRLNTPKVRALNQRVRVMVAVVVLGSC
eukprot:275805-Amphidinium_carterae.1